MQRGPEQILGSASHLNPKSYSITTFTENSHTRDPSNSVSKKLTFVESKKHNVTALMDESRGGSLSHTQPIRQTREMGENSQSRIEQIGNSRSPENLLLVRRRFISPEAKFETPMKDTS